METRAPLVVIDDNGTEDSWRARITSTGHALGVRDSPPTLVLQLGVADGLAPAMTPRM